MHRPTRGRHEPGQSPPSPAGDALTVRPTARVRISGFLLAVQFLTILHAPASRPNVPPTSPTHQAFATPMAPALPWFPVVGGLVGGAVEMLDWLSAPLLPLAVRSVAVLCVLAFLTGGLHLDGFIDCCDGLFAPHSAERRLHIMRDSRVGAFGVVGGVLLILAQYAALGSLTAIGRALALVAAPLLGRWSMVYAVVRFPYARVVGLGTAFRGSARHLAAASAVGLVLLCGVSVAATQAVGSAMLLCLLMVLAAIGVTVAWTSWASHRLGGGLTGDTYGALNELVGLAVLVSVPGLLAICVR